MSTPRPDLVLLGFGMGEGQQLTLEAEALLRANRRAFVIGPTPTVRRTLRRFKVRSVELDDELDTEDPVDGYLAAASVVLTEAEADPPVVVLFPGHPLVSNSLGRYLLMAAGERGLVAQAVPGVSPVDLLVSMTGLDIAAAGLQLFDARRFAERSLPFDPRTPLALLEPAALGVWDDGVLATLEERLSHAYPESHAVVAVAPAGADADGGIQHGTIATVSRLAGQAPPGAVVFIDRYVKKNGA